MIEDPTPEIRTSEKPLRGGSFLLKIICDSYQNPNKIMEGNYYGWILYDFLVKIGMVETSEFEMNIMLTKAGGNLKKAKSLIMDSLIESERVTFEQIKAAL